MSDRIITDTTDFCSIDVRDRLLIEGRMYTVTGNAKEQRFGVEDPKLWVKWAIDNETGERKIIKLVFFEAFNTSLGGVTIRCFRSPEKEAHILELVRDHPYFMQGKVFRDEKENSVRILEVVRGTTFYRYIESIMVDHKTYFQKILPDILKKLLKAFEAIRFLHLNGQRHGDVRNDHIIIESETGHYVWIDFDYDYEATENPFGLDIFGLGNILLYAIGKGFHNLHMIRYDTRTYKDLYENLEVSDLSILDKSRVMNLQKVYPYIPKMLNDILIHFSRGTEIYYEAVEEIVEDVNRCLVYCF